MFRLEIGGTVAHANPNNGDRRIDVAEVDQLTTAIHNFA
jgi:hypothetical protein